MATKLPPMMRPVDTFIYRIKDSAPPICLLSSNFSKQVSRPVLRTVSKVKTPKATRFPRSLLQSLKCEARSTSPPLISPEKEHRAFTLKYPKEKKAMMGSLVDLDQYVVQNGRAKRISTSGDEVESAPVEDDTITSYRTRINAKPDLKPLRSIQRKNRQLEKTLKELTDSIKSIAPTLSIPVPQVLKTTSSPALSRGKMNTRSQTFNAFNALDYNKQLLYNVQSTSPVPLKDFNWQKIMRQSPVRTRNENWLSKDPIMMRKTIASTQFKRLYLSTEEEEHGRESLVIARYPFCRTCVTHSSPIRVIIEKR